ncbi:DUF3821 domain-containing protein [Methanospirillum stamsii]|nr:DUF3821 domain-containing protein [Methanospirillum stamsii]
MHNKAYWMVVCLLMLVLISVSFPATAVINKISPGNEVFIGESGLDLTGYINKPVMIGWYDDPCGLSKTKEEDVTDPVYSLSEDGKTVIYGGTIGERSYGCIPPEDASPSDIQKIEDPADFFVDPDLFFAKDGEWYLWDGKNHGDLVFTLVEPSISMKILDGSSGEDISGKKTSKGNYVNFLIETNMGSATGRTGYTPDDAPFTISLKQGENGEIITEVPGKNNQMISLENLPIDSKEWYWVGTDEGHTKVGSDDGWNTGDEAYAPGKYLVWVSSNLNDLYDNFRAPDGSPYTGRSVSPAKIVEIIANDRSTNGVVQDTTPVQTIVPGKEQKVLGVPDDLEPIEDTKVVAQKIEVTERSNLPVTANFLGYLDLITSDEFNKKSPSSGSHDLQWDKKADNAAMIESDSEFFQEEGRTPPVSYYIDMGNYLIGMERYKDAEDAFETALSKDDRNIDVIIGLGMVKFYLGSYPFAVSTFDDAIKLDARNVLALTYKAVSQANADNLDGALVSIEKATTYGPSDALAWYYAAVIYAQAGDMEKAGSAIQKASALKPDNTYIQVLYDEIAPSDISPSNQESQKKGLSHVTSGSGSTITDLTSDMQSFKGISGFGAIFDAEKEQIGTKTIIRYSERDNIDSGVPVEYHVEIIADPTEGPAPLNVHFSDESSATGGITPIQWTWKSNQKKYSGRDYTHTFYLPGTYQVDWEIRWSDGKVSSSTAYTRLSISVQDTLSDDSEDFTQGTN